MSAQPPRTSTYHFWKMEGTGNDFVFFDGFTEEGQAFVASLTPELVRKICDRHFGIGADGVIVLSRGNNAPLWMRYWNADGTIAEMCGNGLRCTMHFARLRGHHVQFQNSVELPTGGGVVTVTPLTEDVYRVDMPRPRYERNIVPMTGAGDAHETIEIDGMKWEGYGVNVGNPHFVIPVADANEKLATTIGSQMEVHPLFPQKTNVEFAQILTRNEVKLWVWERGCGITLACGSGATATAAALVRAGKVDADFPITMHLPGGILKLEVASQTGDVTLTGPARVAFEGELDITTI
jgi:diaminopimelate epimerase